MRKPVCLHVVGSPTVIVNAKAHPAGKLLEPWRRKVNCLFGLAMDGGFISSTHAYDPSGQFPCTTAMQGRVDPVPLESVVGWTPSLNGNILELLQEPTLMGAYEVAAITALAKDVENNNTAYCSD